MAMGTMQTIGGVNTYVSNANLVKSTTPYYRTYYEINGNVYQGELLKAGAVIGGWDFPVASGTTPVSFTWDYSVNFQIRLNAAAYQSFKSALTY